jgi:hypothetical protein
MLCRSRARGAQWCRLDQPQDTSGDSSGDISGDASSDSDAGAGRRPTPRPLLVVVARVSLLLGAAAAAVLALRGDLPGHHAATGRRDLYICPMHPEVRDAGPGDCPICRMALERVSAAGPATTSPGGGAPGGAAVTGTPAPSPELARVLASPGGAAERATVSEEVRAPAWLEPDGAVSALLYQDEVATLLPDERGIFCATATPDARIVVHLLPERPSRWDDATSRVRFRVDAGAPPPAPGGVGWVTLAARPREVLVIPASAIMESATGPYVLAPAPDRRTLVRRSLALGKLRSGSIAVVSGLAERDAVVVENAFLLDAERRLQADLLTSAGAAP